MARGVRFRKGLRDAQAAHNAAFRFLGMEDMQTVIKPVKKRAAPRSLEGPVVAAISELLAVHPRVIWAMRINSGAAIYPDKMGKPVPVWFHKFLRSPEKMRMPDFMGIIMRGEFDGHYPFKTRNIAIEAKAPGWTKPRDDREREQAAFLSMIRDAGGIGMFATDVAQVAEALR